MARAARFEGRIGRTLAESEPWFDEPPHPGERCAERRRGPARRHRLRPVRVLRLRHRHAEHRRPGRRRPPVHELPRDAAVLAHPGVAAHRPLPARGRACGRSRTSAPASRTSSATSRTTRPPSPRCCAPRATPRSAPASGTSPRWSSARRPGRSTSGRSAAASTASTGSSRARPTSSTPTWSATTTRSTRRPAPEDGYHLSEDLVDQLLRMISDSKGVRPDRPFFAYLAVRRDPRAAPGAGRVPRQVPRARSTRAGTSLRQRWFERQLELGVIPAGHRARAAQPGRRAVGRRCPRTSSGWRPACRRRSPRSSTTPTTRSAGFVDGLRDARRARQHDRLSCSPTTARRQEGGPFGVMHEMKFFNGILETPDEAIERIDDIGGPHSHTNYPWGWAQCGNTPVQVVQAEHPRGRRPRAADRALAGRHRRRPGGHEARPVRQRHRHRAHRSTSCSASRRPTSYNGLEQLPVTGHSFAHAPRRRRTRRPRTRCSTSRWPAAGHSSPASGRRCASTSRAPTTTPSRGSCTTSPPTARSATTSPRAQPEQARRADRAVVGARPSGTACCRSTTA